MHYCGTLLVDCLVDLVIGWYLIHTKSVTASTFYMGAGK
jgi:hypothetical protein